MPVAIGCSAADGELPSPGEEQVGVAREAISLSQPTAAPDEFVGAYTLPNASTVRVSLWGQNPGPPSHSGDWNVTSGAHLRYVAN
jgi:hypothetical protein